jgi:predicted phosphodiesterase
LIISDVHSNIYALEAIWQQEKDSDVIYCTGDLVDYGPFPKEVLDWARVHDLICTQGNHDRWVAACYRAGNSLPNVPTVERAWAHHNAALLNGDDICYLEQLPLAISFELDGVSYGMTHFYQEYEEIVSLHAYTQFCAKSFPLAPSPPLTRLILGHTHRQAVRYLSDDTLWLNPGSASYRRRDDPDQAAHYATISNGVISLKRLIYDIEPLRRAVEQVTLKESEMETTQRYFGAR